MAGKILGTDANDSLQVAFWFDAGSNFATRSANLGQQSGIFDIAQVQLEEGEVATPFEERFIDLELELCQRYYIKYVGLYFRYRAGDAAIASVSLLTLQFQMRSAPTITFSNIVSTNFSNLTGYLINNNKISIRWDEGTASTNVYGNFDVVLEAEL